MAIVRGVPNFRIFMVVMLWSLNVFYFRHFLYELLLRHLYEVLKDIVCKLIKIILTK